MNLLSINIGGGMQYKHKQWWISRLSSEHSISILGIQESKFSSLCHFVVKAMWGNYNFKVASSSSRGRSGGLITVWDPLFFTSNRIISFANVLIVEGCISGFSSPVFIINIYAPQSHSNKRRIWEYLRNFVSENLGEFLIFGDFNSVRFTHEHFGNRFCPLEVSDFNSFINDCNLFDVPLGGRSFTRSNKTFTQRSLIDRFLVSDGMLTMFPSLSGYILSNIWSDHCPIILQNENLDYGPIPFKLFHSWFLLEGFEEVVVNAWNTTPNGPNQQIQFKNKLKGVKEALKVWNNDHKSKQQDEKNVLLTRLAAIDADIDANAIQPQHIPDRCEIIKSIENLESIEAVNKAQKYRKVSNCLGD
ncbi:uncharacterized protein [Rutidosis leptorrhynchoides]|uniref:uncharacterized protein n=1 Tax=Rutidosis leptorrhynchoides TaxID=125765 RepID=UPI003A99EC21